MFYKTRTLKKILTSIFLLALVSFQCFTLSQYVLAEESRTIIQPDTSKHSYSPEYLLEVSELDDLGRAGLAHIRLKEGDQPLKKRSARLKYNPVGWHNFKFFYKDGSKEAWLMNRGHLIGYQFSGLENEARNLVPMTAWLNSGNYSGMDAGNKDSMLYYENQLDNWLAIHPNFYFDYTVTPHYQGEALLPHQIELAYFGIDSQGQSIDIRFGSDREVLGADGVTRVVLDNTSPNAEIDYATGLANNTVDSARVQQDRANYEASTQESTQSSAEQTTSAQENRTVYIARQGRAEVYWYYKENMPSNTNFDNVIEMTEAEAKAQGKRHTSKE